MLRDIDALFLNHFPLLLQTVSPPIETLPMDPAAKDYPLAQIRNLKCPSRVMVFRTVQTSAICKRHSAHFDNLLAEEQKFYAHSLDAKGNPPKTKNFGWHGAPLENIRGILQCGFLIASTPRGGQHFWVRGVPRDRGERYTLTKPALQPVRRERNQVPAAV